MPLAAEYHTYRQIVTLLLQMLPKIGAIYQLYSLIFLFALWNFAFANLILIIQNCKLLSNLILQTPVFLTKYPYSALVCSFITILNSYLKM